jgi:hypothetical protein
LSFPFLLDRTCRFFFDGAINESLGEGKEREFEAAWSYTVRRIFIFFLLSLILSGWFYSVEWFADTTLGRKKMDDHLDMHFQRVGVRAVPGTLACEVRRASGFVSSLLPSSESSHSYCERLVGPHTVHALFIYSCIILIIHIYCISTFQGSSSVANCVRVGIRRLYKDRLARIGLLG